jgi:hypothetical protein
VGCCVEAFTHEPDFIPGGVTFALEAIFAGEHADEFWKVPVYGLLVLMRIVFEGYGVLMLLPYLVPDRSSSEAPVSNCSSSASESIKRKS